MTEEAEVEERYKCCKKGCDDYCMVEIKVHTTDGPKYFGSCHSHVFTMSQVLDSIGQSVIMDGLDD